MTFSQERPMIVQVLFIMFLGEILMMLMHFKEKTGLQTCRKSHESPQLLCFFHVWCLINATDEPHVYSWSPVLQEVGLRLPWGIRKKILHKGTGQERPLSGDEAGSFGITGSYGNIGTYGLIWVTRTYEILWDPVRFYEILWVPMFKDRSWFDMFFSLVKIWFWEMIAGDKNRQCVFWGRSYTNRHGF